MPEDPQCYILTNCTKPTETIIVSDIISAYQGLVVTLQEYPGKYWFVGEVTPCVDEITVATVTKTYLSCQDAEQPPIEPYVKTEPKPDRVFSAVIVSEQEIRDNIKFANAYYDLFRSLKYGINNFCDNLTLEKTWMRKELLDLDHLLDSNACTISTPVTPIICLEPEGNPIP